MWKINRKKISKSNYVRCGNDCIRRVDTRVGYMHSVDIVYYESIVQMRAMDTLKWTACASHTAIDENNKITIWSFVIAAASDETNEYFYRRRGLLTVTQDKKKSVWEKERNEMCLSFRLQLPITLFCTQPHECRDAHRTIQSDSNLRVQNGTRAKRKVIKWKEK